MTTELLNMANGLDCKIKRYNRIMNDIRAATISYSERAKTVKCDGTSLDIEIPDELIQHKVPTVTMGFLSEEGWCGSDMFPMMVRPTFWMNLPDAPLPEPPEKE